VFFSKFIEELYVSSTYFWLQSPHGALYTTPQLPGDSNDDWGFSTFHRLTCLVSKKEFILRFWCIRLWLLRGQFAKFLC